MKAAHRKLAAANTALRNASQLGGPEIASAARQTIEAEQDIQDAEKELHMVAELLEEAPQVQPARGVSGEGLDSLLPHLRRTREQKP